MRQRAPADAARSSRAFEALRVTRLSPIAICLNLFLAWAPLALAHAIAWAERLGLGWSALPLLAWILFLPSAQLVGCGLLGIVVACAFSLSYRVLIAARTEAARIAPASARGRPRAERMGETWSRRQWQS